MKTAVTLSGKEVREIIARFLAIPIEQVGQLKYSFFVSGLSETEVAARLSKGTAWND